MSREDIFQEIMKERDYQDTNWGDEFDTANTVNDWISYVNIYMSRAAAMEATLGTQRTSLLKAAALLVAALETFDKNGEFAPRHYEWLVPSSERPMGTYKNMPSVTKNMDTAKVIEAARQAVLDVLNTDSKPTIVMQEIPQLVTLLRVLHRALKQTN